MARKFLTEVSEQKAVEHLPLVHTRGGKLCKQTEVSKIRQHSLTLEQHSEEEEEETDNNRQNSIINSKPVWLDNTRMYKKCEELWKTSMRNTDWIKHRRALLLTLHHTVCAAPEWLKHTQLITKTTSSDGECFTNDSVNSQSFQ